MLKGIRIKSRSVWQRALGVHQTVLAEDALLDAGLSSRIPPSREWSDVSRVIGLGVRPPLLGPLDGEFSKGNAYVETAAGP